MSGYEKAHVDGEAAIKRIQELERKISEQQEVEK